jgi:hypothetical protein
LELSISKTSELPVVEMLVLLATIVSEELSPEERNSLIDLNAVKLWLAGLIVVIFADVILTSLILELLELCPVKI